MTIIQEKKSHRKSKEVAKTKLQGIQRIEKSHIIKII